jgi:hypothetical protein
VYWLNDEVRRTVLESLYQEWKMNGKYPSRFNSFDSFFEAFKSVLIEDADKNYEQLLKNERIRESQVTIRGFEVN